MNPIEISFDSVPSGQNFTLSVTAPAGITTRTTFDAQPWPPGQKLLTKPPFVHTVIVEALFTTPGTVTVEASVPGSTNKRSVTGAAGDSVAIVFTLHMA